MRVRVRKTEPPVQPPFRPITGQSVDQPLPDLDFIVPGRKRKRGRPRNPRPRTKFLFVIYKDEKKLWSRAAQILHISTATLIRLAVRRFLASPYAPRPQDGSKEHIMRTRVYNKRLLRRAEQAMFGRRPPMTEERRALLDAFQGKTDKEVQAELDQQYWARMEAEEQDVPAAPPPSTPQPKRRLIVPVQRFPP